MFSQKSGEVKLNQQDGSITNKTTFLITLSAPFPFSLLVFFVLVHCLPSLLFSCGSHIVVPASESVWSFISWMKSQGRNLFMIMRKTMGHQLLARLECPLFKCPSYSFLEQSGVGSFMASCTWVYPTTRAVKWAEKAPHYMASLCILIFIEYFLCAMHWKFMGKRKCRILCNMFL